ncbi:MAG TPA: prepilin-type N-terminal cleavage/methylation domain-containing protein [Solirubrobacterales bacterium]|jgi:type II secretory pathway pseudopilin PulG
MRALNARLAGCRREGGFTLVELLVASTMGVVVLGAVGSLVVSAMKTQPQISERAQDVSTARWVLERLTREIRNGVKVDKATASSVSFETYVRHSTCGGSGVLASTSPAIKCEVTYTCSATTTKCTRIEAAPGVYTGTARTIFEGIGSSSVFSYVPNAAEATYIEVTLTMPNPRGPAALTVSDGASLRNATLTY